MFSLLVELSNFGLIDSMINLISF